MGVAHYTQYIILKYIINILCTFFDQEWELMRIINIFSKRILLAASKYRIVLLMWILLKLWQGKKKNDINF